jgi:hypothetical protein
MRRDNLYKQLVSLLKMYMKFTFDAEKKAAADYLWNIVKKYNVDVAENYSEESGKLQQMLQELEAEAQAGQGLALLGLESLVAQLNTANEQVRTLMAQRNDERMALGKAALTKARAEADQAYRDLILSLNASVVMDNDPSRFDDLISQVNELIKYYRQYVVPKGKKDEESEEGGNSGNSGNGGNTGNGGNGNGGSSSGSGTGDNNGGSTGGGSSTGDNNGGNSGGVGED